VLGFVIAFIVAITLLESLKRVANAHGLVGHSLWRYIPSPAIFCLGLAVTSYTTLFRTTNLFLRMNRSSKGLAELLKSRYGETTITLLWSCVTIPSVTTCIVCISALCLLALRISVAGLFGFAPFYTKSQVSLRLISSFPDNVSVTAVNFIDTAYVCWQQLAWSLLPKESTFLPNFTTQFESFAEVDLTDIGSDITNHSLEIVLPVLYSNLSCSTTNAIDLLGLSSDSFYSGHVRANGSHLSISYGYSTGNDSNRLSLTCQSYSYRYVRLR
jgi:hypothetical protein